MSLKNILHIASAAILIEGMEPSIANASEVKSDAEIDAIRLQILEYLNQPIRELSFDDFTNKNEAPGQSDLEKATRHEFCLAVTQWTTAYMDLEPYNPNARLLRTSDFGLIVGPAAGQGELFTEIVSPVIDKDCLTEKERHDFFNHYKLKILEYYFEEIDKAIFLLERSEDERPKADSPEKQSFDDFKTRIEELLERTQHSIDTGYSDLFNQESKGGNQKYETEMAEKMHFYQHMLDQTYKKLKKYKLKPAVRVKASDVEGKQDTSSFNHDSFSLSLANALYYNYVFLNWTSSYNVPDQKQSSSDLTNLWETALAKAQHSFTYFPFKIEHSDDSQSFSTSRTLVTQFVFEFKKWPYLEEPLNRVIDNAFYVGGEDHTFASTGKRFPDLNESSYWDSACNHFAEDNSPICVAQRSDEEVLASNWFRARDGFPFKDKVPYSDLPYNTLTFIAGGSK